MDISSDSNGPDMRVLFLYGGGFVSGNVMYEYIYPIESHGLGSRD